MAKLLDGKFAVVTGGGGGIGKAICQRFAQNGARVIVVDIDGRKAKETCATLKKSRPDAHTTFMCDVSKKAQVEQLKRYAHERWERAPNVVVNCAGIMRNSTLLNMDEDKFDEVINVNLKGVYLVTKALTQLAIADQVSQSIINISSIIGKSGNFGQSNYAATKAKQVLKPFQAGVIGFTKAAAKELAKQRIRVNTVLPGFVNTPLTAAMSREELRKLCEAIPIGRLAKPTEIADAVLFFASDMSEYVTGAALEVTGGFEM